MPDNLPALPSFDAQNMANIAGQLSPRSRRIYENDARVFADWMLARGITPASLARSDVIQYRAWLDATYAKSTAQRMFSVARRLIAEQIASGTRLDNPFRDVRGFKALDETPHVALTLQEANKLMQEIGNATNKAKRDYALLSLLLRTGIRRSEAAALNVEDLGRERGHHIAIIQHGKGDKRRKIKIPVDVYRTIEEYTRHCDIRTGPLFVRFHRGDTPGVNRLTDKAIEQIVIAYGDKIGIDLTPHALRASFITLALEGKAPLQEVQYAAGHEDPRTTQRYQKRKFNPDDNAVDYIHL